ncbi:prephenate dehydrogenase [Saccharothrix violaceirubra]|uniref:Prephenate dehydrogenase n=1 Tax=Saccharothrix violaceirubra TaxID=413306 RepID=A0A7W7T9L7_9PSEU|nr:prephenate dehydrogenase [Saccharothrix violaceirubra]MBB4969040.1 prephenate dehydrogenase [Saccharothrix violaceirubra]
MRDVCVVGLGLIGGSVARAARAAGREVWGATASPADAEAARGDGVEVSDLAAALDRAARSDALVVVAVPLPAVEEVLRAVPAGTRVTDVVSVKGPVADLVRRVAPGVRYVGGHPMAGTSASGWAAGRADLFRDAAWVVALDDDASPDLLLDVIALALDTGAHVVPTTSAEHDAAVARISHLPHLLAAVLASVGADGGALALSLAAGSFGDGTRVAGTRPELVRAMCEGNRTALLDAVDDALGRLGAARGSLASTGGLAKTIDAGHAARGSLDAIRSSTGTPFDLDLTAPDALERLRALGREGGRVTSLEGATLRARTS